MPPRWLWSLPFVVSGDSQPAIFVASDRRSSDIAKLKISWGRKWCLGRPGTDFLFG